MTDHHTQAEEAIREATYALNHTDDPTVEDKLDVIATALIGIGHALLAQQPPATDPADSLADTFRELEQAGRQPYIGTRLNP